MTNINFNPYDKQYLTNLASRKIEPTLEVLNTLDWSQVSKALKNPTDYIELRQTQSLLQQEADRIREAAEEEAQKVLAMNPLHRVIYKTVQKPIAQWWEKIKPQEKELPPLRENWNRGVNLFND